MLIKLLISWHTIWWGNLGQGAGPSWSPAPRPGIHRWGVKIMNVDYFGFATRNWQVFLFCHRRVGEGGEYCIMTSNIEKHFMRSCDYPKIKLTSIWYKEFSRVHTFWTLYSMAFYLSYDWLCQTQDLRARICEKILLFLRKSWPEIY